MSMSPAPRRILFVFAWLVVGGEETEVRLLARHLDPKRYRIDVVACLRRPGMPEQTHEQLAALGVDVDTAPYVLSFEDTIVYLARKIPGYDLVVGCQDVADLYPALERLPLVPPLIEHGGLVQEALAGPKHFTARYVGVCRSIREAAAGRMPGRAHHALEIPSMVDLDEADAAARTDPGGREMRARLGLPAEVPVVGWVGRLDRKKRVEDFVRTAALIHAAMPTARFLVIGGPDAFMPDYADELRALATALGLDGALLFLGDRADVPALLNALDVFVWLARGEGMPHAVAEAGAARLPVVATRDNGTLQQIEDGASGLFVPYENPPAVAEAVLQLLRDPARAWQLGAALRRGVEDRYGIAAVLPRWTALFEELIAEREQRPVPKPRVFRGFFQGGFECSTHRRGDGQRLDVIAAVGHDVHCETDYTALAKRGLLTVRDGLRWHAIETTPGHYDWTSFVPMVRAARRSGTQVIWDLLHYGWPDDINPWRPEFVDRFARFAGAAARVVCMETDEPPFYCPVNEMSFLSWGGGEVGYLNPFARGRGFELKVQLARASIAAMEAVARVDSRARFVHAEPLIHVLCETAHPEDRVRADDIAQHQFQAWDMIAGSLWPQLGGEERYLDVVGVNYYHDNQWRLDGPPVLGEHPRKKPFRKLLAETHARYGRPLLVAETGTEGERRAEWLAVVGEEVRAAMRAGVPVEGICLYPIISHPGWDDDRYCENGLFHRFVAGGRRETYEPLGREIMRQQALFEALFREEGAATLRNVFVQAMG